MTGPEGEKARGWWQILDTIDGGTRMTVLSKFESSEQLEQMVQMGMEEGMRLAIGQMDALLQDRGAEPSSS